MVVFEASKNELDLANELMESFKGQYTKVETESLDGDSLIQIMVPIASVLIPSAALVIQSFFNNKKISIKSKGIEISGMGYKKAMNLLKELQKMNNSENKSNIKLSKLKK